jgi:23S rRNA (pseudouridine1915-N3)-methyltransferase
MLHLNLIALGKLKEKYWVTAEAEYLKRLQSFAKVKILELKEESFLKKDNFEIVKQKEAEKIKKIIPANSFLIVLDSKGKEFTSEDFSIKLQQLEQSGQYNSLTFIIGGPLGLDKEILNLADLKLSFSAMTFTHQMIRIFLLEQIYRGFMIKENRQYHY